MYVRANFSFFFVEGQEEGPTMNLFLFLFKKPNKEEKYYSLSVIDTSEIYILYNILVDYFFKKKFKILV